MTYLFEKRGQNEIWQFIRDINDTWVKNNPEELKNYFHENMVISHPDFQKLGEGREACIKSYKDFCSHTEIRDFKEHEPRIDVFGNTAIVVYSFEISYGMEGETFHDKGRDVFVLTREEKTWWAVWRTIMPCTEGKK